MRKVVGCRACRFPVGGASGRADAAGRRGGGRRGDLKVWTDANREAFIKAPADVAPGAWMTASVTDDQVRADVSTFIKSLPPPR